MRPWLEAVMARGRRLGAPWRADLTNPVDLARLRGRLVVVVCVLGTVASLLSAAARAEAEGAAPFRFALPVAATLVAVGLWAARRGERNTDAEFVALILFGELFAAVSVRASNGPGDVGSTALALMIDTVLAALFLQRRRWVVVTGVATVVTLLGIVAQAGGDPHAVTDFGSAVVGLVVVLSTLRWMRDLAISSLIKARIGEVTDPLTGLANRRGLERAGARQWVELARDHRPLAALVVDVDHFKQINDTQGHAAGDEILCRLGEVLARSLRADDVAVRLGGEEFLVLCSVPAGHAPAVAERLRATVERELAPVTVSIGVHETVPDDQAPLPSALWSTVDAADRALYVAKATGRNRVVTTAA